MRQNLYRSLPFVWTVAALVFIDNTNAILPECTFTGTSGFCAGMAGRFIRPDFNNNIRALYIVGSDLTSLNPEDFSRFQSLTTLHINNCSIPRNTGKSLLSGLKDLKALQITYSDLSDDIRFMFRNNTALNNLSLQWNKLTRITKDTFSHLPYIEAIDVSHNEISEIEEEAFRNLPSLTKLQLSYNKIGENFNSAYLSLSSGECGVCGGECSAAQCLTNERADHLWRHFDDNYDILYLEGNPLCSKIENRTIDDGDKDISDTDAHTERSVDGCTLLKAESCPKHEEREAFFFRACNQDAAEARRKGRSHPDGDDSAPAVDGPEDSDTQPASEEVVSSTEDGDSQIPVVGGGDSGGDDNSKLPPRFPEEEDTADSESAETRDSPVSKGDGADHGHPDLPLGSGDEVEAPRHVVKAASLFGSAPWVIVGSALAVIAIAVLVTVVITVRRRIYGSLTNNEDATSGDVEMQKPEEQPLNYLDNGGPSPKQEELQVVSV